MMWLIKLLGFISVRSTVLQLICVIDNWTEILDEGRCVDVAYYDFMKAFDKVCHKRIGKKKNICVFQVSALKKTRYGWSA